MSGPVAGSASWGGALAGIEVPYFEVTGPRPGPRLCVLAGIHGCEYSSIEAARRFAPSLDSTRLAGSVVCVPVANPGSFWTRTPFVSPADGLNLNRCFPGDPGGSYSRALAAALMERFIAGSDALVDLHGGDLAEALEPFALYEASPVEERARDLALAFGLPWMVRLEAADSPVAGTTSAAAAAAGIPAIIAEVGGRGLLEEHAVEAHLAGLRRVLAHLGMAGAVPGRPPVAPRLVSDFRWLHGQPAGWWTPAVAPGDPVSPGQLLGTISDLHGNELQRITAPGAGVILFLTSSPAVAEGGLLLGLGGGVGVA